MFQKEKIDIKNPKKMINKQIIGERIPIGDPGDFKPCIAKLPGEELLLVCFNSAPVSKEKFREDIILFRSKDNGLTWTGAENLTIGKGLLGREPYITVLKNGTILITVHLLAGDTRNTVDHCRSFIHRSIDAGYNFETTKVDVENQGKSKETVTTRNVLEMQDGTLLMGVSGIGIDKNFIWRSFDKGKTWPVVYTSKIIGLDDSYPTSFLGEGVWWQTPSKKTFLIQRVNRYFSAKHFGDDLTNIKDKQSDQYNRLAIYETSDEGKTLKPVRTLGNLGEMYPSFIRIKGGRILFTFTVRTLDKPLGVRAIIGEENNDSLHFDTEHDIIMLDTKTDLNVISGDGFGPTVELDDGTLITSYSYRDAEHITHVEVVRWRIIK